MPTMTTNCSQPSTAPVSSAVGLIVGVLVGAAAAALAGLGGGLIVARRMGNKLESRVRSAECGVRALQGLDGLHADDVARRQWTPEPGFPLRRTQ